MCKCENCKHTEFTDITVEISDGLAKSCDKVVVLECKVCHKLSFEATERQKLIINTLRNKDLKFRHIIMFGDWAVNEDNDIININKKCANYFITSDNPVLSTKEEILAHLKRKDWFDAEQEKALIKALDCAYSNNIHQNSR